MTIMIREADDIYFSRTREYFKEVLSSYANGNYRSAIVMLYSIAICDILYKLEELRDMYNDGNAKNILKEVEAIRKDNTQYSKSAWEKELIDKVRDRTNLLDIEAYTHLNHLYDYRNFSAHPALNDDYELLSPSSESVIACIKNTLKDILVKPPIFLKEVFALLTDDLDGKIDLYKNNRKELETYLNNRYYNRMPQSMKIKTFKKLWKFCFKLADDENCKKNRLINRYALEILVNDSTLNSLIETEIKQNESYYTVDFDEDCIQQLIIFLSKNPYIFKCLGEDCKIKINNQIDKDGTNRAISWFKYDSLQQHIADLIEHKSNIYSKAIPYIKKHYEANGELAALIDLFIVLYGNSCSFNMADSRFDNMIEPVLSQMTHDQIIRLIEVSNTNNQIYNRGYSYSANTKIVKNTISVLGSDFDFSKYSRFKFDESVLEDSSEQDDVDDDLPI
ncbi:hypothetical protein SAMN02910436_02187 [Ruminococcaceae bacterium P7]|nr:hypothetical protein SAMN02910436_02187 [Ruminococcaceae bacterium P7]